MNKNFQLNIRDDNIKKIINNIEKKKIFLISMGIIGGLLFYLYFSYQSIATKKFRSEITLNYPHEFLLSYYTPNFFLKEKNSLDDKYKIQFKDYFQKNFLASKNLNNFILQSKNLIDFEEYLKQKNTTLKDYYQNIELGILPEKNAVYLISQKHDGKIFLEKYVDFIIIKTIEDIKLFLNVLIDAEIEYYDKILKISKETTIQNNININSSQQFQNILKNEYIISLSLAEQKYVLLLGLKEKLKIEKFDIFPLYLYEAKTKTIGGSINKLLFIFSGFVIGFLSGVLILIYKKK